MEKRERKRKKEKETEKETEAKVGAKENVVRVKESNLYKNNNKMKTQGTQHL